MTLPIENYYVVLNIKTLEWYHGNKIITGAPYRGHTATLYNDYMFIAFGMYLSSSILYYIIFFLSETNKKIFYYIKFFRSRNLQTT